MHMLTQDAPQRSLEFVTSEAKRVNRTVYNTVYREIQYPELVPVDTGGPEWISGVTYFSMDAAGKAEWFTGKAQDVPLVELAREKFETTVHMGAIGYSWDSEEIGKAQLYGVPLTAQKALAARRIAEEMIDRIAIVGDTTKGFRGLVNATTPTASTAPADGTGSATTFASKTPEQILRDVNNVLSGMFTGSVGNSVADTLLLPYSVMLDLSTRRIDSTNQTTVLQWIEANNIFTRVRGTPLTIRGMFGYLDTVGAGSTKRMVAYRRSPEVLTLHMPAPFRFLPVWQRGPMLFDVPGFFRLGGVDIMQPTAVRYLDGI